MPNFKRGVDTEQGFRVDGSVKIYNMDVPDGEKNGILLKREDIAEFVESLFETIPLGDLENLEGRLADTIWDKQAAEDELENDEEEATDE